MVFTNVNEKKATLFGELTFGDYFRMGDTFYLKIEILDSEGDDYCAVDLKTGKGLTIFYDEVVEPITIKEIVYVGKQ